MKMYLSFYSRKGPTVSCWFERKMERHILRERTSHIFFLGASGCQCFHPLASSSETPLLSWVSHAWLWFSALCLNLTMWFSSRGLLLVAHLLYPSALIVLSYPCLNITAWQLVKAHGVTRNKLKIHVICYITLCIMDIISDNGIGNLSSHLESGCLYFTLL